MCNMKETMRHIIFTSLLIGGLIFSACEADRDDNPTLNEPTTFVLNAPAYVNGIYDLEKSKTIELSCSQPDYGYTAPAIYAVEVSLADDFAAYETLASTYTTAKMNVAADELAVAATNLKVAAGATETDFPMISELYIRVRASLGTDQFGEELGMICSNIVALPQVKLYFALPPVKLPAELYLVGDFCGWDWSKAPKMIPVNGAEGVFWSLLYVSAMENGEYAPAKGGGGFKFNSAAAWDGGEVGFAGCKITDNFHAGVSDADGNIGVGNAGWYLVVISTEVSGRDVVYTVELNEPAVWLIGGVVKDGGAWDECMEEWKFTVPETGDADFVSPAFAADAPEGPRAYVKVAGYDWWKSEFMVFDGKLTYRGNGGDLERIVSNAGQKMYINFTKGTGKIE